MSADLFQSLDHPRPVYSTLRIIPVLHIVHRVNRDRLLRL